MQGFSEVSTEAIVREAADDPAQVRIDVGAVIDRLIEGLAQ